jgi:hypothetical protein
LTLLRWPRPALAVLAAAALFAAPAATRAQVAGQAQVYDPQPPPGSAYLRFANALGGELSLRPDGLAAIRLETAPAQRVSPYMVVQNVAGRDLVLQANAGEAVGRVTLRAEPGSYVTVILHRAPDGGIAGTPVLDQADFNRARARLSYYNAAPGCPQASLAVEPGGPVIFDQVAPGAAKSRSVNPVSARLRAGCGGEAAAPFALEGIEAGGMYSVWLMRPDSGQPIAFLTRDTTAPWRP